MLPMAASTERIRYLSGSSSASSNSFSTLVPLGSARTVRPTAVRVFTAASFGPPSAVRAPARISFTSLPWPAAMAPTAARATTTLMPNVFFTSASPRRRTAAAAPPRIRAC